PDAAVAVARSVHLHGLEIGEQHVAVLDRRLLLPEEKLRRAQPERIVAAVEHVPQDDVRELVDEHRRHVDRALEKRHVGAFDGAGIEQPVAETQQQAVVALHVTVFQRLQLLFRDAKTRLGHQRGVQLALQRSGLLYRVDLRPQVIGAQEVVGDAQPARRVALEKMETAIAPKISWQLRHVLLLISGRGTGGGFWRRAPKPYSCTDHAGARTSREWLATCCLRNSIWSARMRRLVRIRYSALFGTYGAYRSSRPHSCGRRLRFWPLQRPPAGATGL